MDKLILGIGGMSKKVLKLLEEKANGYDMAVLDCWSRVQEIEITEDEVKVDMEDPVHIYFKRNLSFFITPPKVALRFDENMFDASETQKVLRDYNKYRQLLKEEYELESQRIIDTLNSYKEIIIISSTSGWLPADWLAGLIGTLQYKNIRLRLLLACPLDLEGPLKREISEELLLAIRQTNVEAHVFYMKRFASNLGNLTMKEFFRQIDKIFKDGALSLAEEEALSSHWQQIDLLT